MNNIKNIARKIIVQECKDLIDILGGGDPMLALGIIPYVALVINESLEWCRKSKIEINGLSNNDHQIIKKLRAKCKLYSGDNKYSIEEQKERLLETINIEKSFFKNQSYLAKKMHKYNLIEDVGLYLYDTDYIGNTILYSYYFESFRHDKKSVYDSKREILMFSETIGQVLQRIVKVLDGDYYKIKLKYNHIPKYYRKDDVLDKSFFYGGNIERLMLFNILCSVNFINKYLSDLLSNNSTLLFRIKYLVMYHAIEDIRELNLLEFEGNKFIKREFRNGMAHYGLFNILKENKIMDNTKLFGIVESIFNISYEDMIKLIDVELIEIKNKLEVFLGLE